MRIKNTEKLLAKFILHMFQLYFDSFTDFLKIIFFTFIKKDKNKNLIYSFIEQIIVFTKLIKHIDKEQFRLRAHYI